MSLTENNFEDVAARGKQLVAKIRKTKKELDYLKKLLNPDNDGNVVITIQSDSTGEGIGITVPLDSVKAARKKLLQALKGELTTRIKGLRDELKSLV